MPLVLDASVAAAWCFPDEGEDAVATDAAHYLVESSALVPPVFWFEIRNVLLMGERRGRVAAADTGRFLDRLGSLPLEEDHAASSVVVLDLARAHKLSVYDAAYLELARRRVAPLATLDRRLAAAAAREGLAWIAAA